MRLYGKIPVEGTVMASGIPWYDRRDALIIWDEIDDPHSNLRHILDAGYTSEDVEHVMRSREAVDVWNDGDAEFAVRGSRLYAARRVRPRSL